MKGLLKISYLIKFLKKDSKYQVIYTNLSRNSSLREITVKSIENNILKAFDSISNEVRSFNLKRIKIIKKYEDEGINEEI